MHLKCMLSWKSKHKVRQTNTCQALKSITKINIREKLGFISPPNFQIIFIESI